MGFKPGHKKIGGRVKGTKNRFTADLEAKCEAQGIDPFTLMLEYLTQPCDPQLRLKAIQEVCRYLYPQRKALEIDQKVDGGIEVVIKDYTTNK